VGGQVWALAPTDNFLKAKGIYFNRWGRGIRVLIIINILHSLYIAPPRFFPSYATGTQYNISHQMISRVIYVILKTNGFFNKNIHIGTWKVTVHCYIRLENKNVHGILKNNNDNNNRWTNAEHEKTLSNDRNIVIATHSCCSLY
jgi:hypothetical protein